MDNKTLGQPLLAPSLTATLNPLPALAVGLSTIIAAATLTLATSQSGMAQATKPSPIPEDTSHLFIPVARVNPDQPITVTIINDTDIPLEYGFSTNDIAPQELIPDDEVTLESAPIPTGLFINAFTSAAVLDYAIEALPDNALVVTVSLVDQLYDASGFSAIDIHESGAIYRY